MDVTDVQRDMFSSRWQTIPGVVSSVAAGTFRQESGYTVAPIPFRTAEASALELSAYPIAQSGCISAQPN